MDFPKISKFTLQLVWIYFLVMSGYAQTVTGTVFIDENRNGIFDQGESGLEGVIVSNQVDVVLTDKNGQYAIPLKEGNSLMVVKPGGYQLPLDEFNIPQFSYEYEPSGSPEELKYGGLKATGKIPEVVDFALYHSDSGSDYRAIFISDPQPRDDRELTYIRDTFVNQATLEEADLMLVLGDIMYDDLSLFDRHKALLSKTEKVMWHVVGNHDLDFDTDNNRHARDTYKSHFGPNYYAFNQGEVTYLVLDNVDYKGLGENGRPVYEGRIWGEQLTWIENLLPHLPKENLIIVATHIPLYSWDGEASNVNTLNREDLFRLLKDRKKLLSVSGHLHMTYHHFLDEEAGWVEETPFHHLVTTSVAGTWWGGVTDMNRIPTSTQRDGNPNGYHLFSFQGSDYTEDFIGLGEPSDFQLRIEYPTGNIYQSDLPEKLIVNIFNGSSKNEVYYRINGGDWYEMNNVTQPSPYFEYLLTEFSEYWSENIRAIPTNHIWESGLELPGSTQTYRIDVKTKNIYGKEWVTSKLFEMRE
jgi:hypothetical protein